MLGSDSKSDFYEHIAVSRPANVDLLFCVCYMHRYVYYEGKQVPLGK